MSAQMCGKRAFLRRRVSTPLDAQHTSIPTCASREMPVQVMTSAFPRVWLATTPRASNAARKGRRQPPTNVVPLHAFQRRPRPQTSAVGRSRLHPSRAATLDGAGLRDARETDEVSLDILAKDDVGVLQVPTRRRPFASGPGNFTEKSREPRVPRDFHESRNLRRTSPFVTSTPRSSWLTDHLLDPSTRPSPAP